MWATDVGDVGNAKGKQEHRKVEKQESRKVEKQDTRKQEVEKQESRRVGKQESRKVRKVVKVKKSGKQGSREVGSRKYEV